MGKTKKNCAEDVPQLTDQFFVTLRARIERAKPLDKKQILEDIDQLVRESKQGNSADTWHIPYEIEQKLCLVIDEPTLDVELQARLYESAMNLHPKRHEFHKRALESAGNDVDRKRAVLLRMMDDLQWHFTKRAVRLEFGRKARANSGSWLLIGIALFAVACFWFLPVNWSYIVVALVAGFLGASFSIKIGLQVRLAESSFEDLKLLRLFRNALPRLSFGMGAALILVFLVHSGLLGGSAFPQFERGDITKIAVASRVRGALVEFKSEEAVSRTETQDAIDDAASVLAPLLRAAKRELDEIIERRVDEVAAKIADTNPAQLEAREITPALAAALRKLMQESLDLDPTNLVLLIVWCFLAGFSEKLVPGLLAKVEGEAGVNAAGARIPAPTPVPESEGKEEEAEEAEEEEEEAEAAEEATGSGGAEETPAEEEADSGAEAEEPGEKGN